MTHVFNLFPTPLARVERLLDRPLVADLARHFAAQAQQPNAVSPQLAHTELAAPRSDALLQQATRLILPHVAEFGELLLGERLTWLIKEMWGNVLESGGHQALHNHANSFVSGIIYLSESHPSAQTVFAKAPGGSDFVFNNTNARAKLGAYNAGKWVSPVPAPGDLLLFPSYLLHEVPTNGGERRISLAFNAIPHRLDSWGYTLSLSR
jgi:uncharacterized protein (TIGR02466 family)